MKRFSLFVVACVLSLAAHAASSEGFALTQPESVGFSTEQIG